MGEKGNDSVHQVTNVGTWGDGHRSFLLAERAPSECARSMRAVKDQAAMPLVSIFRRPLTNLLVWGKTWKALVGRS